MRILLLSHDKNLFKTGSESQHRMAERGELCEAMFILVSAGPDFRETKLAENVTVIPVGVSGKLRMYFALKKLAKRIAKEQKIDLIISQNPFEFGRIAMIVSKKLRIPYQVDIHGDFYSSDYFKRSSFANRIRHRLGIGVLRQACCIRAVSERIRSSLVFRLGISDSKIMVFPVESGAPKFLNVERGDFLHSKFGNFDFFLLSVNTLGKVKNVPLQLRALKDTVKEHPKTALVIVGDGPERANLENLSRKLGISQNVVFAGTQTDVAPYYAGADIFMLTSHSEGCVRAVTEAMAAALPVVMTDVGTAGELVINGRNGIVIPEGNKDALVNAVKKLLLDAGLRKRLGEEARATARLFPSHDKLLNKYRESWERCACR
jgi:glycosyltransferase involved in cell wall biosynthesis